MTHGYGPILITFSSEFGLKLVPFIYIIVPPSSDPEGTTKVSKLVDTDMMVGAPGLKAVSMNNNNEYLYLLF
jgi:hypothetical protein